VVVSVAGNFHFLQHPVHHLVCTQTRDFHVSFYLVFSHPLLCSFETAT